MGDGEGDDTGVLGQLVSKLNIYNDSEVYENDNDYENEGDYEEDSGKEDEDDDVAMDV